MPTETLAEFARRIANMTATELLEMRDTAESLAHAFPEIAERLPVVDAAFNAVAPTEIEYLRIVR